MPLKTFNEKFYKVLIDNEVHQDCIGTQDMAVAIATKLKKDGNINVSIHWTERNHITRKEQHGQITNF